MTKIIRSTGNTPTEKFLAAFCDQTFLKLWTFPNPYKKVGDELCDVLVVFENQIFIFSVKEILFNMDKPLEVAWPRWKRKAIDESIKQIIRAERWVRENPERIFLDPKCEIPFPFKVPAENLKIHKIVVADGAYDACLGQSPDNVTGSLAVTYEQEDRDPDFPFCVSLNKNEKIHLLDSKNLAVLLGELDTIYDLGSYFLEKERAINTLDFLSFVGEEDLLAHYFLNFDPKTNRHKIGLNNEDYNGVIIGEGEWADFIKLGRYHRRKEADKVSYVWDDLLQRTSQNALDGVLLGDGNVFGNPSAITEMAKEPRFHRRGLAENIGLAINDFPSNGEPNFRKLTSMPSFYDDKRYVFLQISYDENKDYEKEVRPVRRELLTVACWAEKERFPHIKKVVGIAIDSPIIHKKRNSEDFVLLNCENWPENLQKEFKEKNEIIGFYKSKNVKQKIETIQEFPSKYPQKRKKIGRNEKCPCGSGLKYKRCCLNKR